jgi:hypothetical protein
MRVLIRPSEGKRVRDNISGNVLPADGRMFEMGPYWMRLRKKGLVIIQEDEPAEKVIKKSFTEKKTKKGNKK